MLEKIETTLALWDKYKYNKNKFKFYKEQNLSDFLKLIWSLSIRTPSEDVIEYKNDKIYLSFIQTAFK